MQNQLDRIVERLRNSGLLPSFVAPYGTEPPPQLKGQKPVTRVVGRHRYTANEREEGDRAPL